MNYKYKCLLQRLFSSLPKGEILNYYFQRHVSKSLHYRPEQFVEKVDKAYDHFKNYRDFQQLASPENKYYEFGAGWTLANPLAISLMGFDVFCIDIRRLFFPHIIKESILNLKAIEDRFPFEAAFKIDTDINEQDIIEHLKQAFNLKYLAPKDARSTGFESEYFDFMSSSLTMEHIPAVDIAAILKECHRILKEGGVLSMTIDYQDHWSYFDRSITRYNYLRFSESEWKKYNPSLHYQNRLRHSDHMKLINASGFEVVKEVPNHPSPQEVEELRSVPLADQYKSYDFDDLAIKSSEVVLRKS